MQHVQTPYSNRILYLGQTLLVCPVSLMTLISCGSVSTVKRRLPQPRRQDGTLRGIETVGPDFEIARLVLYHRTTC